MCQCCNNKKRKQCSHNIYSFKSPVELTSLWNLPLAKFSCKLLITSRPPRPSLSDRKDLPRKYSPPLSAVTWPVHPLQHWRAQGVSPKPPLASLIFSLCLAWTRPNTTSASVRRPPVRPPRRPSVKALAPLLRMVLMKYVRTFPWRSLTCNDSGVKLPLRSFITKVICMTMIVN